MATEAKQRPKPSAKKRMQRNVKQKAKFELVLEAARAVTKILDEQKIQCAVFGSLAAKLYGSLRSPNDVDMLVCQHDNPLDHIKRIRKSQLLPVHYYIMKQNASEPLSAHQIKELILHSNSRNFYYQLPKDPNAGYLKLYYRQTPNGPECKVDILIPGIMHLPSLDRRLGHMHHFQDGPWAVPFGVLLLHKLQGWDDHRKASLQHYKRKQVQDAADVKKLLSLHWVEELRVAKVNTVETPETSRSAKKKQKRKQVDAVPPAPVPTLQPGYLKIHRPEVPPERTIYTGAVYIEEDSAPTSNVDPEDESQMWWANPQFFSPEFIELTKSRVWDFCLSFPARIDDWRMLGFKVPERRYAEEVAKLRIEEARKEKELEKLQAQKQAEVNSIAVLGQERAEQNDDDDDDDEGTITDDLEDEETGSRGEERELVVSMLGLSVV